MLKHNQLQLGVKWKQKSGGDKKGSRATNAPKKRLKKLLLLFYFISNLLSCTFSYRVRSFCDLQLVCEQCMHSSNLGMKVY